MFVCINCTLFPFSTPLPSYVCYHSSLLCSTNTFLDYIKSPFPAHPLKSSCTPHHRPCSPPGPSASDSARLSTPIRTRTTTTTRKERSPCADPKRRQGSFETSLRAIKVQEADRRSPHATYREASHRSTNMTLFIQNSLESQQVVAPSSKNDRLNNMNQHPLSPTTSARSLQRVFVARFVHIFVISLCRGMLSFPFGSRFSALNNSVVLFGVHIHRLVLLGIVL